MYLFTLLSALYVYVSPLRLYWVRTKEVH